MKDLVEIFRRMKALNCFISWQSVQLIVLRNDKCPYLIDRCSSLSVIPKIFVQSCESVLEQPCLGVLEFERNGHGSGDNVPNTQSEEQEG